MNCNLIIKLKARERGSLTAKRWKEGKLIHNYRCNNDRIMQTHNKNNTNTHFSKR